MEKNHQKKAFLQVPVEVAKDLGHRFEKDQVIILSWNREHHSETVTTWGKTVHDADQAAAGGNALKIALKWPDENCHAVSAKVQHLYEVLELASFELLAHNAQKSTAYKLIQEILKTKERENNENN